MEVLLPDMPVRYLKGVGPKIAENLSRIGISTIEDLLRYYPRDWEDRRCLKRIGAARAGESLTLYGTLQNFEFTETRRGLAMARAQMSDETGRIDCLWMRRKAYAYDVLQGFKKAFVKGRQIMVFGEVGLAPGGKTVFVKDYQVLNGEKLQTAHLDRIVPVYPVTEGVAVSHLRGLIHRVLPSSLLPDPLPQDIRAEYKLMPLHEALDKIHFPKTQEDIRLARERLAFEELFLVQTVLALVREKRKVPRAFSYGIKKDLLTPFRLACGFEFTSSQKRVIKEIFADLRGPHPMNRLLQGDVGSGKTVVAVSAMLLAAENGLQSALMAPTEILAEQHFITLKYFLRDLPVSVGLLTGSADGKAKERFKRDLASGKIQIAVGTHALLEDTVNFKRLGLVVIDEQHRFGVKHRLKLTQRDPQPDTLVMTATPIPRTLALGLYGDLDVSTIDELPPGRQNISTAALKESEAMKLVQGEVAQGHQAYIVYPLIDATKSKRVAEENEEGDLLPALDLEESGILKLKAAEQEYQKHKARTFKARRVALLHGRMNRAEKERVMLDFKERRYDVLVATTVIEVGIDVPNATVMVIENAERFGLSTLHQLRGRVGRGKELSRCLLVGQPRTAQAKRRLDIILKSGNGFEIAEEDLKLRGPGEIFGLSQHGLPPFKIADFNRDLPLLQTAQKAARSLVEKDPGLTGSGLEELRRALRSRFSKSWLLAGIA